MISGFISAFEKLLQTINSFLCHAAKNVLIACKRSASKESLRNIRQQIPYEMHDASKDGITSHKFFCPESQTIKYP